MLIYCRRIALITASRARADVKIVRKPKLHNERSMKKDIAMFLFAIHKRVLKAPAISLRCPTIVECRHSLSLSWVCTIKASILCSECHASIQHNLSGVSCALFNFRNLLITVCSQQIPQKANYEIMNKKTRKTWHKTLSPKGLLIIYLYEYNMFNTVRSYSDILHERPHKKSAFHTHAKTHNVQASQLLYTARHGYSHGNKRKHERWQ